MAVLSVERLPDEPIIIARLDGLVDADTARQVFEETARLAEGMTGHLYRITDCTCIDADLPNTMGMLLEATKGKPASTSDPNVTVVLVGGHQLTAFYSQAMAQPQFGGVNVRVFPSVEEALVYIRFQIRRERVRSSKE
jgi:hypothetical protein